MKPLELDWKDRNIRIKFGLDVFDQKQLGDACSDVIDILRKKHKLSTLECDYVLWNLRESLREIAGELFDKTKEMSK